MSDTPRSDAFLKDDEEKQAERIVTIAMLDGFVMTRNGELCSATPRTDALTRVDGSGRRYVFDIHKAAEELAQLERELAKAIELINTIKRINGRNRSHRS